MPRGLGVLDLGLADVGLVEVAALIVGDVEADELDLVRDAQQRPRP